MRKYILALTSSLTASTTTEMLCMKVQKGEDILNYFIEYPTNIPPNHNNLYTRGNSVTELLEEEYDIVAEAFTKFDEESISVSYLHPPTFVKAYCLGKGFELNILN